MKNRFFITASAIAALFGCDMKNMEIQAVPDRNVELTLIIPSSGTKATGTALPEDSVNDLQVLVFNSKGMLETYRHSDENTISLSCTSGEKRIAAFVNAGHLDSVKNTDDLDLAVSDLSDNGPGNLVMSGDTVLALTASCHVELDVRRMAARIAIGKIENAMTLPQHREMEFEIKSIYLVNVPGDNAFFGISGPSKWYNRLFPHEGAPSFLYDEVENGKIPAGSSYTCCHYFYSYPNHVEEDVSDAVWSPRKTRLVVEASLGGITYYYPVTLDNVKRNTSYSYELRITRPGSSSPDIPVDDAAVGIEVKVKDWTELPVVMEEI